MRDFIIATSLAALSFFVSYIALLIITQQTTAIKKTPGKSPALLIFVCSFMLVSYILLIVLLPRVSKVWVFVAVGAGIAPLVYYNASRMNAAMSRKEIMYS